MKCQVHRAKPKICRMFPIGRCIVADNPKEGLRDINKSQVQYIFTNPGCGNDTETHTVREWLELFGISVPDEYFIKWQQTVLELGTIPNWI